MKVLIIKTSSMGDVIHTLPALTDAKKMFPEAEFDWLVEEGFSEIPSWHPAVNRVIPVAIRRWRKTIFKSLFSKEWKDFKHNLRLNNYDKIIDAQGLLKSAYLSKLARGETFGYSAQCAKEPVASFFYKHKVCIDKNMHAIERIRCLFAKVLNYKLPKAAGCYNINKEVFSKFNLDSLLEAPAKKPYFVFIHGTTRQNKCWPTQYWKELATHIAKLGYNVYLPWGNDLEKRVALDIKGDTDCVFVLPKLSLSQLAMILSKAKGAVAVDTGLGHLAAALSVPTVSIYGTTNSKLIGTYGFFQKHLSLSDLNTTKIKTKHPKKMCDFTPLTPNIIWTNLNHCLEKNHVEHSFNHPTIEEQ